MNEDRPSLLAACAAEALGTFLLVLLGCGAVHSDVLSGAQSGLWQVAVVWGIAVMLACYVVGGVSGAHINPAITVAFAVWRKFPAGRVIPYIVSQTAGAFLAAAVLFGMWGSWLTAKENAAGVERGKAGSEITAMCYGEYYPNPGLQAKYLGPGVFAGVRVSPDEFTTMSADDIRMAQADYYRASVPHGVAFGAEVLGTLILALVVAAVGDGASRVSPRSRLAPVFIGLAVASLVSILAPLTQACLNPARDFGPRLLAYFAGWGEVAIPGPNGIGFLTVYIVAPCVGAVLGMGIYEIGRRSMTPVEA